MAKHRFLKIACLLAPVLGACAQVSPNAGLVAAQPATDPAREITPYSGALACLRGQLATVPGQSQFISVGLIPDATGRITPGIRDMVSAAVVSATNGSVRYIPTEAATVAGVAGVPIGTLPSALGLLVGPPVAPQLGPALPANAVLVTRSMQVVGALSQADKAVQQSGIQGGLGVGDQSIGASSTSDYGVVTLDLRLVDVQTGVILQSTSNMLVVRNSGRAANAALRIGSFGVSFDASFDRQEGPHQAVRTLVDLSVAELLGRQAHVPYWKCLSVDTAHPAVREQIRAWYQAMTPEEIDRDVRARLRGSGMRVPDPPAAANEVIAEFQQKNGLVANGRPTFETYATLVGARLPVGASVSTEDEGAPPPSPTSPSEWADE